MAELELDGEGERTGRLVLPWSAEASEVEARVELDVTADPRTRTLAAFAWPLDAVADARAGLAGYLEWSLEPAPRSGLAVPSAAILRDGLVDVLFRRDPTDPNVAMRVEADPGPSDGRWTLLESGVTRGDEVVVEGAYELMLATRRSGAPSEGGHVHADGSFHEEH